MKKGFTLNETVVVIGILIIISIIMADIFVSHNRTSALTKSQTDVQKENFTALTQIKSVFNESNRVLPTRIINSTTYTSSANAIVLEQPAFNSTGTSLVGFDYAAIYRDATDPKKIYIDAEITSGSRRPSGKRLITENADTLVFRYNSSDVGQASLVEVFLKTKKVIGNYTADSQGTTTVYLQNK